jgi:aerobic-type carbon monoxide dehydrogenase small subunit (CoxS/CutS family)
MIMSAKALLDKTPNAAEEEIKAAIAGNLCRCTGYVQIIDSIKAVSGHGQDEPQVVAFKTDEKDRGE